ncbi:MAG: hypothetical protein M1609_14680 [Firmicutes bacterium]|nr:hypothetical protein [Bacillota bacterium]
MREQDLENMIEGMTPRKISKTEYFEGILDYMAWLSEEYNKHQANLQRLSIIEDLGKRVTFFKMGNAFFYKDEEKKTGFNLEKAEKETLNPDFPPPKSSLLQNSRQGRKHCKKIRPAGNF